tara:strand:- start:352 stop:591 length:240 start_codon:yes stop_codon:yes gene_type:complete
MVFHKLYLNGDLSDADDCYTIDILRLIVASLAEWFLLSGGEKIVIEHFIFRIKRRKYHLRKVTMSKPKSFNFITQGKFL